jgi:hypothetical protein
MKNEIQNILNKLRAKREELEDSEEEFLKGQKYGISYSILCLETELQKMEEKDVQDKVK